MGGLVGGLVGGVVGGLVGGLVGGCVVVVVTGLGGWRGSSGMGYSYLKISSVIFRCHCFR